MPFKPNYRFDRAERTRSKEAKKAEKLEAQAARRKVNRNTPASTTDTEDAAFTELNEDYDGFERANEKED